MKNIVTRLAAFLVPVFFLITGCVTRVQPKLSLIASGMTKEEVISKRGPPSSVSAHGAVEFLTYDAYTRELSNDMRRWDQKEFFVKLVGGRVESFGQKGDFGTTRNDTLDLNIKQDVTTRTAPQKEITAPSLSVADELTKLHKLLDEGVITREEFERQKKRLLEN